jgi:hypothetical protein
VLIAHFEPQERAAWCGVASATIVLNALGEQATQTTFFTPAASEVRSSLATTMGGMTLAQLGALLEAHDVPVVVTHAEDASVDVFREALRSGIDDADDFITVNYLRSAMGQQSGGHISPVAAYDEQTDRVLVLDVSSYKYPPVWVEVATLFAAMNTRDSSSSRSRGWTVAGR